jgi:general secretion pathway protein D
VLILASQNDIEAVDKLIDKLDQTIDPSKEFEVFRLRYAIASQVITAIDSFLVPTGWLRPMPRRKLKR